MAERENPVVIIGGIRYRKDDAARLGLTEESGTKKAPAPKAKKGADDGGSVSGTGGGAGDSDKPAGGQPAPISSSKQS